MREAMVRCWRYADRCGRRVHSTGRASGFLFEELERVAPIVEAISQALDVIISVDTSTRP